MRRDGANVGTIGTDGESTESQETEASNLVDSGVGERHSSIVCGRLSGARCGQPVLLAAVSVAAVTPEVQARPGARESKEQKYQERDETSDTNIFAE